MRFLEIKDLDSTRKVQLVLLLIAVSSCCCTGRPQKVTCLIQSYFRARQGNGVAGIGNLLRVPNWQLTAPSQVSFNGSCNDPKITTEFLMEKEERNGSLIVSFRNVTHHNYALAIRNETLVMEHVNNIKDRYKFELSCALASCASTTEPETPMVTLKNVLSHCYVMTDKTGKSLVGKNPAEVTTWIVILGTKVCDV
ncbi:hypothetical protein OS493_002137 [Desmophyllum pertusum]|uniref:Uncharacterized protein n=1 Tax=Desmophyllum pertusum TaxID=174260 RepID=A0A9W9Z6L4_9CNID|nr:hypothetical protein OS493_002137 [Desmophyllum pertusum]